MNPSQPLSHIATARALRALVWANGAWGAWAQMVSIQTAVFTGLVLGLGASESTIAHFISLGSFSCLAQILSSAFLAGRLKRKKAFVILMGCLHTLFRFCVVLVPLVFYEHRLAVIGVLVGGGLMCWHLAGPILSGWNAQIIPESARARFLGRQTMANLGVGIAASYAAGWYLDLFPDDAKYPGFFAIFGVATLLGMAGFLNLARVPFRPSEGDGLTGDLSAPFRNPSFRNLLAFFWVWSFAWALASPFYSVFMLKTLHINYTTVAVLSSMSMASMALGSRFLGGLIDRFGSKAMLQILVVPCALTPVLWAFSRPGFYPLIPVAMALNGMVFADVLVSVNALLYGTVPRTGNRTAFFACWSTTVFLAYALAPLLGSALVELFKPVRFVFLGIPFGNIQMVFFVSAGLMVLPNGLLRRLENKNGTTPGGLLSLVGRGNLLGYLYNATVFNWAQDDQNRARALRRMGRSRSPMAMHRLIRALADASPEVRRQAARGLGETQDPEALPMLLDAASDAESDIRSEALEALGKIGDSRVIDPLVEALEDPDLRVRISAIRALSEMGGDEAGEVLFWKFADKFERATFPTLADTLGAARDLRMVRPTLERMNRFRSPAIRMQLLNSVCRALGGGRLFYRLVSQGPLARSGRMEDLVGDSGQAFRRDRVLPRSLRIKAVALMGDIRRSLNRGEAQTLFSAAKDLSQRVKYEVDEETVARLGDAAASRIGASVMALETFFPGVAGLEDEDTRVLFLVVVLWCIGDAIRKAN